MANNLSENYYDILNVRKDATFDEIKKAYRDLAKQYHPDRNKAPEAAERFKMINRAHQVLSDPDERKQYDINGNTNSFPNFDSEYFRTMFENDFPDFDHKFKNDDPFTTRTNKTHEGFSNHMRSNESANFSTQERKKEQNRTRNTEFGKSGFFTDFGADRGFNNNKRKPEQNFSASEPTSTSSKRARQEPSNTSSNTTLPKDPAIERPLEVSLEEFATGCTKKLKIKRKISDERGCCTLEENVIEIKIKPGWKAGTKLTYTNYGDKFPGREPADITFILKDKRHPLFTRDSDNNLLHTANVSLKNALLGVSYCVQGLNGVRHDVNVKDIIHPGYVKRYPGEGLPLQKTPTKRGDLIVTFNIQFPTFLSWDQRRVLSDCLPN